MKEGKTELRGDRLAGRKNLSPGILVLKLVSQAHKMTMDLNFCNDEVPVTDDNMVGTGTQLKFKSCLCHKSSGEL